MDINKAKPEDYKKTTHTLFHDAAKPSGIGVGIWSGKANEPQMNTDERR
jgi:hypothetical protein